MDAEQSNRCKSLRQELRIFEKAYAAANHGKKPPKTHIKANPQIHAKYKEYNALRDIAEKEFAPKPAKTPTRAPPKRKAADQPVGTPSKKRLAFPVVTPKRKPQDENVAAVECPPSASPVFTKTAIGPTPQKDGIFLGLFDVLPSETPSKGRTALQDIGGNVLRTPSNHAHKDLEVEATPSGRTLRSRTPVSEGKRFLLDKFATPKKRKLDDEVGTPLSGYPQTPSFLRRDNHIMATVAEEDEDDLPVSRPPPWKSRGIVRSLSSIIQGLKDSKREDEEKRKQEQARQMREQEERLDEEWDIMREMEGGEPAPKKVETFVAETQVEEPLEGEDEISMPLGTDGMNVLADEAVEEVDDGSLDRNGNPRKAWKKKGQKRTTRRVIMRPVKSQPKPQAQPIFPFNELDEEAAPTNFKGDVRNEVDSGYHESLSDDSAADSDYSNASHDSKRRKTQVKPQPAASSKTVAASKESKESKDSKDGVIKKTAKKISATAHANYRALKIKNRNSKAGGRRFGRGRR